MNPLKRLFGGRKPDTSDTRLEEIYVSHLGEISSVFHETENRGNHVDVYRFNRREGREFVTYLSGGISRRQQPGPGEFEHVELMLYADEHSDSIPNAIRNFSHYPWETGSAFLGWDLLPLKGLGREVLGSDDYGGILVCPGTHSEDHGLAMALRSLHPMVSILNLMPLLHDEFHYAETAGVEEFFACVSASDVSVNFNPSRRSVLSGT